MRKKTLLSDAISMSAAKAIVAIMSILMAMLIARFRTLSENGTYSQLLVISNIASNVFFLGMPNSVNYFLPRTSSREEQKRFISTYYFATIIIGICIGVILMSTVSLWERYFDNPEISAYSFFLFLFPLTKTLTVGADNLLINYGWTGRLIKYRLLHSFVQVANIVLIQMLNGSYLLFMWTYILIEVAFSVIIVVYAGQGVGGFRLRIDSIVLSKIIKFSLPLGIASAMGIINIELDKLVIGYYMSTEQMAVYSNASKDLPVTIISSAFTAVLMPKISEFLKCRKTKEAFVLWNKIIHFSYLILIFIVTFFVSFSREILTFLYSEKYVEGYNVFIIYSICLLFQVTYFGLYLNVSGNTKCIMFGSFCSLIINVILNVVLYNVLGMIGPAISSLIAGAFLSTYQIVVTAIKARVNIRMVFDLIPLIKPTVICLCLGIVTWFLKLMFLGRQVSLLETIMAGIIWCVVYMLLVYKDFGKCIKNLKAEKANGINKLEGENR